MQEKQRKQFIIVKSLVVNKQGRILFVKREREWHKEAHNKWELPGGKVDFGEHPEETAVREAKEEAGVEIDDNFLYINSVAFIRPDEIPVILVKFAAKYKSGEVQPEQGAFNDYAWVNEKEVKNYQCIKGVAEEVAAAIKLFKKQK